MYRYIINDIDVGAPKFLEQLDQEDKKRKQFCKEMLKLINDGRLKKRFDKAKTEFDSVDSMHDLGQKVAFKLC